MDTIGGHAASPPMGIDRPLERKMAQYLDLDASERALLEGLSGSELRFARAAAIASDGAEQNHVYVIKSGWCSCARHLSDGRRQITRFAVPGDFLCFDSIVTAVSVQDVVAITDVTLLQLKVERLGEMAANRPRLAVAMLWMAAQDDSALAERVTSLGRRFALERLAHLFVETYVRLDALGLSDGRRMHFPVTKEQLADAMGLTTIHIYRTLRRLTESGLIRLDGPWLEILDFDGLKEQGKFDPLYIEPSKIPAATNRALRGASPAAE